jgi:hypothetical protein
MIKWCAYWDDLNSTPKLGLLNVLSSSNVPLNIAFFSPEHELFSCQHLAYLTKIFLFVPEHATLFQPELGFKSATNQNQE